MARSCTRKSDRKRGGRIIGQYLKVWGFFILKIAQQTTLKIAQMCMNQKQKENKDPTHFK
jgi:hypothetical protein